jgi:hypothetical protein
MVAGSNPAGIAIRGPGEVIILPVRFLGTAQIYASAVRLWVEPDLRAVFARGFGRPGYQPFAQGLVGQSRATSQRALFAMAKVHWQQLDRCRLITPEPYPGGKSLVGLATAFKSGSRRP